MIIVWPELLFTFSDNKSAFLFVYPISFHFNLNFLNLVLFLSFYSLPTFFFLASPPHSNYWFSLCVVMYGLFFTASFVLSLVGSHKVFQILPSPLLTSISPLHSLVFLFDLLLTSYFNFLLGFRRPTCTCAALFWQHCVHQNSEHKALSVPAVQVTLCSAGRTH